MSRYLDILKQYWGYDCFRDLQEEIITSIGEGKDTLGLMPTGGGKSITFQVPALAKEGICIVITPLIALMKDQVQNLKNRGVKALAVYSGMTRKEIVIALENCIFGDYKFLYISPERLDTDIFKIKLRSMNVSMITVDESHCISQWGYDFRPAYLKIANIRELLPNVPILALTATATPEVVKDIQKKLFFKEENLFQMSFERKNLAYIVRNTDNKQDEILHILSKVSGSAIIYARSRKRVKDTTEQLRKAGVSADFYHAGVSNDTKDLRQKQWQAGEFRVMVATNAFGMGIDKSDVRVVIHIDLPDSPEAYFQEAGRAGRDGKKAYAVILYSKADKATLNKRVVDTFPEKEYIKQVYEHVNYYYQMAMGDGLDRMYDFNLEEFCRNFKYFPVPANGALKILSQAGYIEYTDEQDNGSRLIFTVNREELYRFKEMGTEMEALLQVLLRSYTGVFTDYAYIHEDSIAKQLNWTRVKVYEMLKILTKRRVIDYVPHKKTPYIIYKRERMDLKYIHFNKEVYEDRKERYIKRIAAMIDYVTEDDKCRSRMLLRYFGEKNEHDCSQCDVCIQKKKKSIKQPEFDQLALQVYEVTKEEALTPAQIVRKLNIEPDRVSVVIQYLLEQGKLIITDGMIRPVNES